MKTLISMTLVLGASVVLLSGCGEKPQAMGEATKGVAAYQGVGSSGYVQSGWKAGDKGSWEQALKARAQYGQNDYTRMGNH
jgi:hypothetical protein